MTGDRRPYVGEGADGARRSAQIDREEADTLDPGERRDALLASAERWEAQARARLPGEGVCRDCGAPTLYGRHLLGRRCGDPPDEDQAAGDGEPGPVLLAYEPSSCPPCGGTGRARGSWCAACMGTGTTIVGPILEREG